MRQEARPMNPHHHDSFEEAFRQREPLPLVVFNPRKQKVPIRLWLTELDAGSREQILNLSQLQIVRGHVAVMPDAHMGIGCSVGTVFATEEALVPSTVGVDLGCGMMAVRFPECDTHRLLKNRSGLQKLHKRIRGIIPTGFSEHKKAQEWEGFEGFPLKGVETEGRKRREDFESLLDTKARRQLGTLGGGNHLMLHSGSRYIGNRIGVHFMRKAKEYCDGIAATRPKNLDWLPLDHPEGRRYVEAVAWAQRYARSNRHQMMNRLLHLLENETDFRKIFMPGGRGPDLQVENHHNFVQKETHFGREVWVHRKGAVSAKRGEWGILPGSMATGSYIVRGRGNPESLCSCAHGSGRRMSRTEARKTISIDEAMRATKTIVGEPIRKVLDEAPQAYKDLENVMNQQRDLIETVFRLTPLLNVKGY